VTEASVSSMTGEIQHSSSVKGEKKYDPSVHSDATPQGRTRDMNNVASPRDQCRA
jgi:hypothetical protein